MVTNPGARSIAPDHEREKVRDAIKKAMEYKGKYGDR